MPKHSQTRTLIFGGNVLVLDGVTSPQQAMVVEGGRVLGAGSLDDMSMLAGSGARKFDLDGATAMPGLVDSHPHFMHFTAIEAGCVNILDARNFEEIVARIEERAKHTPKGQWIVTTPVGEPSYFVRRWYHDLEEGRMPDRKVLDRATSDHPVLIQAWAPRTPNIVAFNSLGLAAAGISSATPDQVCNVRIEKDDDGQPSGVLRGAVNNYYVDDPFWLQILAKLPQPPEQIWRHAGVEGQKLGNSLGVTACYEAHCMEPEHILAYRQIREDGQSTMRVSTALEMFNVAFDPHAQITKETALARLALAKSLTETDDELFRCSGTSLARGGPCWPGYLRIHDEMMDPWGKPTRGKTFIPQYIEKLVIEYCLDNDLRLNMVQGGYRDQDDFFESLSAFTGKYNIAERRWVSQHNILIAKSHCDRLAELNMDVTTSVGFAWGKGDLYAERIGKHCWKDLIPLKRMVDAGINVACGTDWGPKNVFHQIALAETHEFSGSGHCNDTPDHKLTREESLLTWTRNPARVMMWDDEIGTLEAGKRADIAIVDRNPMTVANHDLADTKVLQTVLNGETVYDAGGLARFADHPHLVSAGHAA